LWRYHLQKAHAKEIGWWIPALDRLACKWWPGWGAVWEGLSDEGSN
jgi:hypothetical protein